MGALEEVVAFGWLQMEVAAQAGTAGAGGGGERRLEFSPTRRKIRTQNVSVLNKGQKTSMKRKKEEVIFIRAYEKVRVLCFTTPFLLPPVVTF